MTTGVTVTVDSVLGVVGIIAVTVRVVVKRNTVPILVVNDVETLTITDVGKLVSVVVISIRLVNRNSSVTVNVNELVRDTVSGIIASWVEVKVEVRVENAVSKHVVVSVTTIVSVKQQTQSLHGH